MVQGKCSRIFMQGNGRVRNRSDPREPPILPMNRLRFIRTMMKARDSCLRRITRELHISTLTTSILLEFQRNKGTVFDTHSMNGQGRAPKGGE